MTRGQGRESQKRGHPRRHTTWPTGRLSLAGRGGSGGRLVDAGYSYEDGGGGAGSMAPCEAAVRWPALATGVSWPAGVATAFPPRGALAVAASTGWRWLTTHVAELGGAATKTCGSAARSFTDPPGAKLPSTACSGATGSSAVATLRIDASPGPGWLASRRGGELRARSTGARLDAANTGFAALFAASGSPTLAGARRGEALYCAASPGRNGSSRPEEPRSSSPASGRCSWGAALAKTGAGQSPG